MYRREVAWLVAALCVLGTCWALLTPPVMSWDEDAHITKAVALWHGQLRGDRMVPNGDEPGSYIVDEYQIPGDYAVARNRHFCVYEGQPLGCMHSFDRDQTPVATPSEAGNYPPLYYAFVGWPSRVIDASTGIYGIRVMSVVIFALAIGAGWSELRRRLSVWVTTLLTMVAVTPTMMMLAGSVNPNGFEIAAAFAAWSYAFGVFGDIGHGLKVSTHRLVGLVASIAVFAGVRTLSPVFAVVILGVAWWVSNPRVLLRSSTARLATAACVVASLLWAVLAATGGHLQQFEPRDLDNGLGDKIAIMCIFVGQQLIGWSSTFVWGDLTLWFVGGLYLIGLYLFGRACVRSRSDLSRAKQHLPLALLGLCVVVPSAITMVELNKVGVLWQPRYALPLVIGAVIAYGVQSGDIASKNRRGLILAVGLIAVVIHVVSFVVVAAFFDARGDADLSSGIVAWSPPAPLWALLAVTCVVGAGVARRVVAMSREATTPSVPEDSRQARPESLAY